MDDALLLPAGTRLVHIGPHKTGTTSLQGAFHAARREVERQGVHYAGPNRQAKQAARAVAGRPSPYADGRVPRRDHWTSLLRDVRRSPAQRVLVSAEGFADARQDAARRLIRDLDPARVHVVATLRPLVRILPSQWQQYVQNGLLLTYDAWLRGVFEGEARAATPTFWNRHRHDRLLARWAEIVGPENVTAVVVDDRDHEAVLRTFERLLGLRPGTLRPTEGISNRSLTRAEVELVRAMHAAYAPLGITKGLRLNLVLHGAAANMKLREPSRDEPRIETPAWVAEPLARTTRQIVDGLAGSGVRVIGDLETLVASRSNGPSEASNEPPWPIINARALLGVLAQTGMSRGSAGRARRADPWPDAGAVSPPTRASVDLTHWSTPRIAALVGARTRSAFGSDFPGLTVVRGLVRRARRPRRRRGRGREAA